MSRVIFDDRWEGQHGIGRMTREIKLRLLHRDVFDLPAWPKSPVHPLDPLIQGSKLLLSARKLFYSPGFNAPLYSRSRAIFTICDLIHIKVAGEANWAKLQYYEWLVKPAVAQCFRVLTISEYSRRDILDWSRAAESQVTNVGCGVDAQFLERVAPMQLGFPYLLYVGGRKPHKNLARLLEAYSRSKASRELKLVLSGDADDEVVTLASRLGMSDRMHFAGRISEAQLPAYYQGAAGLLFPSYFEGFGLPPVEAMAGGTPVLTSNTTSLPEVVGDAALMVDPFSVDALSQGVDRLAFDTELRRELAERGPLQASRHSWDAVASKVSLVLNQLKAAHSP